MSPSELLRSTTFRLATALAALFGASTLLLSAFTSASPKPLGIQVVTFEGDEYGTAGKTASTAASTLLEGKVQSAKSDDTTKAHGGDPLDHRDGTEEW